MSYDPHNDKFIMDAPAQTKGEYLISALDHAKASIDNYFKNPALGGASINTIINDCFDLATVQYYLTLGVETNPNLGVQIPTGIISYRREVIRTAIIAQIRGYIDRKETRK